MEFNGAEEKLCLYRKKLNCLSPPHFVVTMNTCFRIFNGIRASGVEGQTDKMCVDSISPENTSLFFITYE